MYFLIYSAFAWEANLVNGEPASWNERSIPYYINTDGVEDIGLSESEVESVIQNAAEIWHSSNIENATFEFSYQGSTKTGGADLTDGEHVVSFDDSWTQGDAVIAIAHVWPDSNGNIVHFDIEVNIDGVEWTTSGEEGKHDLQNSMAHEFGHALGLEHSDDAEATMAATTPMGETTKRDLHEDDILGFVTLYPYQENAETQDSPEEQEASNHSSGSSGGSISNPIDGPSNTGSGNRPVALEKSGCSTAPTSVFWLGILALFQVRRRS
jgi:hypothetical protein